MKTTGFWRVCTAFAGLAIMTSCTEKGSATSDAGGMASSGAAAERSARNGSVPSDSASANGAGANAGPGSAVKPKPAPDFELKTSDGRPVRLSSFKGRAVLVHFWAKWCPPCVHEIPAFMDFARKLDGKPAQIIAVSMDPDWKDAHDILPDDKVPANVLSVLDPKTEASDKFGSFQFPETYLIDREGRIVQKWVGPQDWTAPQMLDRVTSAL